MIAQWVLQDIAQVIDCEHRTAPAADGHSAGYSLGTRSIRDGRIRWDQAKPVSAETLVAWTGRAVPQVGDLILSREAPMGEVALVPAQPAVCLGQRTVLLRPTASLEPKYLLYRLMAPQTQGWIRANALGSTVLHINVADVRRMPVGPLPSLTEQRQIVDMLEDHLSRLDAATSYLNAALLRTQRWAAGMADHLIWGTKWPHRDLASLLREPMRNGRSDRAATGWGSGIRTLTLTAVTRNEFTDANTKLTTTLPSVARGLWLQPGDILVQRANTPDLVGTAARFDGPRDWAIFPDLLIRVRPDEAVIDSRFLIAAMRSERSHRALRGKAKGLAGSMPKIDQAALGAVEVPVPPAQEQARVIDRLREVDHATAALKASLREQELRSSVLRRQLLTAAFSGRLAGRQADSDVVEELAGV